MLTAEVFNWTGHVLMTPRTQIAKALARDHSAHTGVYLLIGEDEDEPLAYIGEAENMAKRLGQHVSNKDWWTTAILMTTAADVLNKAHVKYLEARLVEVATAIGRVKLENGNTPPRPGLTEADAANMEAFLGNLMMVLPALRIDMFLQNVKPKSQPYQDPATAQTPEGVVKFTLQSKRNDLHATARLEDGEFIVEAGSDARENWIGTDGHSYSSLRKELEANGTLVANGNKRAFTQDYAFKSPSAAGAIVQGRPTNGTIDWKVEGSSMTCKQWEQTQLEQFATD